MQLRGRSDVLDRASALEPAGCIRPLQALRWHEGQNDGDCDARCSCVAALTCLTRLRHLNLRWLRNLEFDCQWFRQWADMRTLQLDFIEGIRNSAAFVNQPGLRLARLSIRSCVSVDDQVISCLESFSSHDINRYCTSKWRYW